LLGSIGTHIPQRGNIPQHASLHPNIDRGESFVEMSKDRSSKMQEAQLQLLALQPGFRNGPRISNPWEGSKPTKSHKGISQGQRGEEVTEHAKGPHPNVSFLHSKGWVSRNPFRCNTFHGSS
jgi:hypothetical protein